MREHPHFCDCDDCINGIGVWPKLPPAIVWMQKPTKKQLELIRFFTKRSHARRHCVTVAEVRKRFGLTVAGALYRLYSLISAGYARKLSEKSSKNEYLFTLRRGITVQLRNWL